MPSQQPDSTQAPIGVTSTPMQTGQPLGNSAIIAMVLDILLFCAVDPTITAVLLKVLTGHRETTEAGPTGLAVASAQAYCPAEAVSLVEAFPTAPTEASAPATVPP